MNFTQAFKLVIGHEGGYQRQWSDRGNWTTGKIGRGKRNGTKYGISAMSYPHLDIKNLTLQDAQEIYLKDYWNKVIKTDTPDELKYILFDTAINSGRKRAVKILQQMAYAEQDGMYGTKTNRALKASVKSIEQRGGRAGVELNYAYGLLRCDYLTGISTFNKYGRGWIRRVVRVVMRKQMIH